MYLYFPGHDIDENSFLFYRLHSNVGACLHSEILLLHTHLRNPGDESVDDPVSNGENSNQISAEAYTVLAAREQDISGADSGADLSFIPRRSTSGSTRLGVEASESPIDSSVAAPHKSGEATHVSALGEKRNLLQQQVQMP
jgi:hypothetical protein